MKFDLLNLNTKIIDLISDEAIFKLVQLSIGGIEVTQATQYYRAAGHLTDASDRGPDNSIRLIAGKPSMIRVYLSSFSGISGVSGTLEVQRRYHGFMWQTVANLTPMAPVLTDVPSQSQGDYATVRGTLNQTLNFIIPAEEMIGTLRLIARVEAGSLKTDHTIIVPVTLRQTLRIAGVMIAYNGPANSAPNAPNLQLAAPTLAELQLMSARALALFPVQSQAEVRVAGNLTLTNHLQDTSFPTSGCGAAWDTLHGRVANARTADGNQPGWIYYGFMNNGVPRGPVGGCGGGGVGVGPVNADTLAHECGYAAGLGHAPAGGAPNPDPGYPAYEPYDPPATPQASIGEFGVDVNNGTISSPQFVRDFMAYGGPDWISPYHYGKLLNKAILNPATVGIDSPWWKDRFYEELKKWPWLPIPDPPPFDWELPMFPPDYPMEKVISLIVRIENGFVSEVMHVARTQVRTHLEHAKRTNLKASLRSKKGETLAQSTLFQLERLPGGCGDCEDGEQKSYIAQAFIPDVAKGASLEISSDKEVLWHRGATKEPCEIKGFKAKMVKVDRSKDVLQVDWKIANLAADIWVRWSTDGENWKSLATNLTGEKAEFEARVLPPGRVLLQLVTHDGFFSRYSEPIKIVVLKYPPEVTILHPVDGYTYMAGQSLRLWGVATGSGGTNLRTTKATWLLGREKIAQGLDGWSVLEPGKHVLTLQVKGETGTGTAKVKITVDKPPKVDG
ncbi:MAG: hypothetical protein ACI8ZB_004172 [Desulforhopalus sp.]|jgi:hypothetical protein